MILPKDIYFYIMNFTDDKTILNMLSVNKKFNDVFYFERVINHKYPLLKHFKNEEENWKQFFVKMNYYNVILEEQYEIPYIPDINYNPEDFYKYKILPNGTISSELDKFLNDISKREIIHDAMHIAVKGGHIKIVQRLLHKSDLNLTMYFATQACQINILEFLIEKDGKGGKNIDGCIYVAGRYGPLDMVKFIIEKGGTDFNGCMYYAAKGGHIDIVKFMVEKGATNFEGSMSQAAGSGHDDIFEYLENLAAPFNN